jgi:eukaryotic-like serine/threonine-protein kinase
MRTGAFGPFEILDQLGAGGMGVVYRARDTRLFREVALKLIRQDASWSNHARDRLLREARAISALNHPNICSVYDIGDRDGQAFIVMELVRGTPLTLRLAREGLPPETVTRWGVQLADALEHAHQQGVVHRDVKPSNVVVTPGGQVKLVDFGIAGRAALAPQEATIAEDGSETSLVLVGTPPYMAPELLRGGLADARSDVWSLGVLLHELLSGERPFAGTTVDQTTGAILHDPPRKLPAHVPRELATIVERCLAKDAAVRYQRAGEVRAALEAVQSAGSPRPRRPVAQVAAAFAGISVIAVTAVLLGAPGTERIASWFSGTRSAPPVATPKIRGLAVLPLRNIGGDPAQDFFADGMTSALITELAKVERLKVISQTSILKYRATSDRSLPQIGRELDVDAVIEGAVLRVGDRVRITVDLVDVSTDRHLWAQSYERPIKDVLRLQDEIARAVVAHVESRVAVEPRAGVRIASVAPAAYEEFLRGEINVAHGTPVTVTRAVAHYQQAIALDPDFAPAYAGLAGALFAQEFWGTAELTSNSNDIRRAVEKALVLDPNLADAHVMMARVQYTYEWDFDGAEKSLKRAIALSPGLSFAHETLAWVLLSLGRREDAIAEARAAAVLNPRSAYMVFTDGRVLHRVRLFDQAEERYKQAIALDPGFGPPYSTLIHLYIDQGRLDDARAALAQRERLPSVRPQEWLRIWIDAVSGKTPARSALERLEPMERARVNLALRRYDAAFEDLDRAVEARRVNPARWTDAEFDPIRADPRFARLVERMGLPVDRLVKWGVATSPQR